MQTCGDQVVGRVNADDPHCPECGGVIGMTAAYCMHCSADLTEERERVDVDNDEDRNDTSSPSPTSRASDPTKDTAASDGPLLDPDGLLDNSLTVVVGIIGGFIIGFIGWFAATSIFSIIIEILSTNLELLRLVVSVVLGLGSGIVVWLGATKIGRAHV